MKKAQNVLPFKKKCFERRFPFFLSCEMDAPVVEQREKKHAKNFCAKKWFDISLIYNIK